MLYGVANVTARRGCIRGDGAVKQALVYVAAVMLQRAFWATVPSPDPTPFSPPSPPPRSPWKVPNTLDLCGFSAAACRCSHPRWLAGPWGRSRLGVRGVLLGECLRRLRPRLRPRCLRGGRDQEVGEGACALEGARWTEAACVIVQGITCSAPCCMSPSVPS